MKLTFEGQITGVKPKLGTANTYQGTTGAGLEVTLTLAAPSVPRRPADFEIKRYLDPEVEGQYLPPADVPTEPEEGESKADFTARKRNVTADNKRRQAAIDAYEKGMAEYLSASANFAGALQSYAMMVGLTTVLGHAAVVVTFEPRQSSLPGLADTVVNLLPPGE